MKTCFLAIVLSLSMLGILFSTAYGTLRTEYTIQINRDGSVTWTIVQTGTDIQVSPDTLKQFQTNITSLVQAAGAKTQRSMAAMAPSITSTVSGSYVEADYRFSWENFSKIENTTMTVGDVFQVENFFGQLYGDGEVTVTYPSGYVLEAVSPPPIRQDDSHQTLEWAGTGDFSNGLPFISLKEKPYVFMDQNVMVVLGLVVIGGISSASYYTFRRRRKKPVSLAQPKVPVLAEIESDEEKVVKLLRSSGGGLFQSAITQQCKFSKAKTSQLLSTLESKGMVRRHKRGRDKIVVLTKEDEK
jgi:uncharacterized membrane protein